MYAAVVTSWGSPPTYTTIPDLPSPSPSQIRLRVLATCVHRLVLSRAAGKHYTSAALPHLPGVDGVGQDPVTGKRYYFASFQTGSFAEFVNADRNLTTPLPPDADPITAAALTNPVMSSWMALSARAAPQPAGFSVAILGATTASGRAAVDVVRAKGAGRVVGIARNAAALAEMPLDGRVVLLGPETDWAALGRVDVVLDYVYGEPAAALLAALPGSEREVQFVNMGSMSGEGEMRVPQGVLRGKRVALRGSGLDSWTMEEYARELAGMVEAVARLERRDVVVAGLEDVEKMWREAGTGGKRVVFVSQELAGN